MYVHDRKGRLCVLHSKNVFQRKVTIANDFNQVVQSGYTKIPSEVFGKVCVNMSVKEHFL